MATKIHNYVSQEPLVRPNAFIVEGDNGLVIVDTTLTMSDSKALKQIADGRLERWMPIYSSQPVRTGSILNLGSYTQDWIVRMLCRQIRA